MNKNIKKIILGSVTLVVVGVGFKNCGQVENNNEPSFTESSLMLKQPDGKSSESGSFVLADGTKIFFKTLETKNMKQSFSTVKLADGTQVKVKILTAE